MTIASRLYSTAMPLLGEADPNIVAEDDSLRCRVYALYEDIYHNRPETFKLTMRGDSDDQKEIYLPGARRIIEATNRFLAKDFDYVVNPRRGQTADQQTMDTFMGNLFKRERMYAKHQNQRRYGLIRGDAIWHVTANDMKEQGTRISIHELHPGRYFPIMDELDPNKIVGAHLVDVIPHPNDPKKKTCARRQTYRKVLDAAGNPTGPITSELALFELGKWDDRNLEPKDIKLIQVINPETPLHPLITSIPIYHVPNSEISGADDIFGLSEIAGIETILAAKNQTVQDTDLSLTLAGLGVYFTTAGPPRDPNTGEELPWVVQPGGVLEVPQGETFGRVQGITSVTPYTDHQEFLRQEADTAYGVPDVASGRVDVAIAESGVSLMLQFAPLLAKNAEKEQVMLDTYDHMLYDITHMWMPAYEGVNLPEVSVASVVGDAMPVNRDQKINEIVTLISSVPPLITIQQAMDELSKLGYDYSQGDDQKLMDQLLMTSGAMAGDQFANRYEQELEDGSSDTTVGTNAIDALSSSAAALNDPMAGMI